MAAPSSLHNHGAGQSSSVAGQEGAPAPAAPQLEGEQERPAKRRKGRKGAKTGGADPSNGTRSATGASFSAASSACDLHNLFLTSLYLIVA